MISVAGGILSRNAFFSDRMQKCLEIASRPCGPCRPRVFGRHGRSRRGQLELPPLPAATRGNCLRAMRDRGRVPAAHWRHASGTRSNCREIASLPCLPRAPCLPIIFGRHGTKGTEWDPLGAQRFRAAGGLATGAGNGEFWLSKSDAYSTVQYQSARPISRWGIGFCERS